MRNVILNRKNLLLLFGVSILWTASILTFFILTQRNQLVQSAQTVTAQTQQNLALGNFYHVNKGLNQLVNLGLIECLLLTNLDSGQEILRLSHHQYCSGGKSFLNIGYFDSSFKTIDGNHWRLMFNMKGNKLISFLFWATLLIGLVLLNAIILFHNFRIEQQRQLTAVELKTARKLAELAQQVSHDIRSPLSALSMITSGLNELPEHQRLLIRSATQRINDIANDLLQKGSQKHTETAQKQTLAESEKPLKTAIELVPALVDVLVSEKRMQFRNHANLSIETDLNDGFGTFAKINSNDIKRVLSNLINNAVEAFPNQSGQITVGVRKGKHNGASRVEIFVQDNGKGIPKHILAKLGQMGVTHGKEGTQSGSGLGVYHAKKTVEALQGSLEINSVEGQGTTFRLFFPTAESPQWFASKIELCGKQFIVSLDDDESIHRIWGERLIGQGLTDLEHIRFQSGEDFINYVNSNIKHMRKTLYLVDYELLNQTKSGLDIIEDMVLKKYSILVTSRYEDKSIQSRVSSLRMQMLPKPLAGFVPLIITPPKDKYDWVLIDDDSLVHDFWKIMAKEHGVKYIGFKSFEEFKKAKESIEPSSAIYIDSNLGNEIKGEDVARTLHKEGFTCLYIATGYEPDAIEPLPFLKGIVGKDAPIAK